MNHRIAIYARTATLNAYGEQSDTYSLSGSVWGRVKHSAGDESVLSGKENAAQEINIVARNFSGTTGDEIEYDGYRWGIEGVRRKHRQLNTTITANRLRAV
tara:strand:+ start:77 stop:379 length:303 start_codon:yes stop_codon:yes gene_type:complete